MLCVFSTVELFDVVAILSQARRPDRAWRS
jgi:hypothetical protein